MLLWCPSLEVSNWYLDQLSPLAQLSIPSTFKEVASMSLPILPYSPESSSTISCVTWASLLSCQGHLKTLASKTPMSWYPIDVTVVMSNPILILIFQGLRDTFFTLDMLSLPIYVSSLSLTYSLGHVISCNLSLFLIGRLGDSLVLFYQTNMFPLLVHHTQSCLYFTLCICSLTLYFAAIFICIHLI